MHVIQRLIALNKISQVFSNEYQAGSKYSVTLIHMTVTKVYSIHFGL